MITSPNETTPERHLRRKDAAKYVVETYNVPCSPKTLAKLACVSSKGPRFGSPGDSPFIRSRASTPGRRRRSALWSGQRQKPAPPPDP